MTTATENPQSNDSGAAPGEAGAPPETPRAGAKRCRTSRKTGNRNAMKSGLFAVASLPKGASYIRRLAGSLRREIEAAVLARYGEVSLCHAALAQSAARHEARAHLCQRWLRLSNDTLSAGERLAYVREIGSATDRRDACLARLGLDRQQQGDVIAALYAAPAAPKLSDDSEDDQTAADASGDALGDEASDSDLEADQQ